jgi:hypothetical protein
LNRALLLVVVLAGCADAGTTDSARCQRACERDEMCNMGTGSPFCAPDCVERMAGFLPPFRQTYLDCHADTACNDDPPTSCEVQASQMVEQRQLDDNFLAECQTIQDGCEGAFDSAFCFLTRYYEEAAVAAALDCLELSCGEVEACLRLELPLSPFD